MTDAAGVLGDIADGLRDDPGFFAVRGRQSATLVVPEAARAAVLAATARLTQRSPIVVAVPTVAEAETLAADLRSFLGAGRVDVFPAWETLPFERVSPSVETMGRRMRTMWHLRTAEQRPDVVVAPARALVQRLGPHVEDVEPIVIRPGEEVDRDDLVERLVAAGYRREHQVEHRGECAVRGSIVDVFPSTEDHPVRVDLWGDEVDRLCRFGIADQRAGVALDEVQIFPCRELLATQEVRDRAAALADTEPWAREQWDRLANGETFDGMESWLPWLCAEDRDMHVLLDLVDDDAQIVMVEPRRIRDRASDIQSEEHDLAATLSVTWGVEGAEVPPMHTDVDRLLSHTDAPVWTFLDVPDLPDTPAVETRRWSAVSGDGAALIGQMQSLRADDYRLVVAVDGAGSVERVERLLAERGVIADVRIAPISRGVVLPAIRTAFLSESDLTGRRRTHRRATARKRAAQRQFDDLAVGSYVVHEHHGVAKFAGMVRRTIGGAERDYLLLEYRGADKLYVPTDGIDAIRLYTGGESPTLSKMGGADFARAKSKVRSEVDTIAQELVVLYQKRVNAEGRAFGEDTPWQRELEDAFPYEPTPDQLAAVHDVKGDMEVARPMDRLVVGDVGFGKTEVALRAAFKAIQDGTQVGLLVPTTLLAQQHFSTFTDRFAPYPVRVEVLSRFLTAAQARKVAEGVKSGDVDLVIGTHRLLSEDIEFKNLGLLIVDEEQRFGVSHKESIKQMKSNVDVLTLTATPIPRTMEMSLTGIRDLSMLQTAPADRQPILTLVGEYDERAVAEAIRRELLREGQVFYVHNRVADIDQAAEHIRELVPEARVAIAHGQMDEGSLERVVIDFWDGKYDVLVCTTIIESGIDMPTVNTLVVARADLLGLGQLHQLRGRVGRAGMRAYAYLFYPENRELSEEAYARLKTIGESTELGSGFRIAMRDLELRGAGNLLGTGQSGHIAAVGYDLYCQMVNEAIGELNGEVVPEVEDVTVELPIDAHLPNDWIEREDARFEAYRRLADTTSFADIDDVVAEWKDRFGAIPAPALALVEIAKVRAECRRVGVTEISVVKSNHFSGPPFVARCSPLELPQSKQMRLERLYKGAVYKTADAQLQLPVRAGVEMCATLLEAFAQLVPQEADS